MSYELTYAEINNRSPFNKSSAKMRYSFPKTERFNYGYGKNSSKQFLYNLPEVSDPRGTSLGYGKKSDFMKVEDYKKASITDTRNNFNPKKTLSPSYTFGASRSVYDKVVSYIYIFFIFFTNKKLRLFPIEEKFLIKMCQGLPNIIYLPPTDLG